MIVGGRMPALWVLKVMVEIRLDIWMTYRLLFCAGHVQNYVFKYFQLHKRSYCQDFNEQLVLLSLI